MTHSAQSRQFIQCDVFSPVATQGNGLAVVVDGDGLTDEQFKLFAAWTNLAETTFLLSPTDSTADYRVRIFTPTREMPFAGHPTLGSCAAWLHCGGKPKVDGVVRQECEIGIVEIQTINDQLSFMAPPTTVSTMDQGQINSICESLGISTEQVTHSAVLNNGPNWLVLQLQTAEQVLAVNSSRIRWPESAPVGLIGPHQSEAECDFEVRMLAPSSGMAEDPITGSLNAAIAQWFYQTGQLTTSMLVAQGTNINRHGRVAVHVEHDTQNTFSSKPKIWIGGETKILISGHVFL